MSKRNIHRQTSTPRKNPAISAKSPKRKWRQIRQFALVLALLAGVVGSGLAAFKHSYDVSHDLSVVGKGIPAVVQIHDPNCPMCNQLRRNADAAMKPFGDQLLYRIADISTPTGRQLQIRHDVPHVTLLLFDGDGKVRNVLTGVKSDELLQHAFKLHLERWG
jgi:hypothetical protein